MRLFYLSSFLASFLGLILICTLVYAKTSLPLPRFVSLRANEVNARTGPNVRYPVRWVFVRKNEPVEITAEFEQWRKVRDKQGDFGWVHESMLSGKRFVIVTSNQMLLLRKDPEAASHAVAKIEPDIRAELLECEKDWCRIEVSDFKGWTERKWLWGVYPNEEVK